MVMMGLSTNTVLVVDLDFGSGDHEHLAYLIKKGDEERAEAVVRWVKDHWWDEEDPHITYDDAIERDLKKAGIWFSPTEYHVVWVNYYE